MKYAFFVIIAVAVLLSFVDFMMLMTSDPEEFIRNNIRNPSIAREILKDSVCDVDTASSNSADFIDKFTSDYPYIIHMAQIDNFYRFVTSKYEVIIIRQNYKKFSHDEVTFLAVKNEEGEFVIYNNRVSDKLKKQILLKAFNKYKEMYRKPENSSPTNIKIK